MSWGQPFAACQARFGAQSSERDPDRRPGPRRAHDVPASGEDAVPPPAPRRGRGACPCSRGRSRSTTPTREPEAAVAAREEPDQQPQDDRPGEQVGLARRVEMARGEIARQRGRDRREDLGSARSAQVARHERDEDDDEPHLEGGQQSHGRRRDARAGRPRRRRAAGSAAAGRRSRMPGAGLRRRSTSRRRGSRRRPTRPATRRPSGPRPGAPARGQRATRGRARSVRMGRLPGSSRRLRRRLSRGRYAPTADVTAERPCGRERGGATPSSYVRRSFGQV